MEMINERIATLKAEKLEMQQDYLSLSDEEQNVIAMANMRISMELEFLDKLNKALVISSLDLNELKRKLDDALESETTESLNEWLNEKRQ